MTGKRTKRLSLDEIERMAAGGELHHDPEAPEGPALGAAFWAKAAVSPPQQRRSVHLRLDPDVFDYFVAEAGGKSHLTRMQMVLKAYADARRGL